MIDTSLQLHDQLKTFDLKESRNELKIKELEDKVELLKSQILQLGMLTQDIGYQVEKLNGDIISNKKVTENSKNVTDNKEKNINKLKVPERLKFRCSQCKFTSKMEITLKKHKNTKHGNSDMKLGEGQFGIVLDVRPGNELEADKLIDEWKKETTEVNNKTTVNEKEKLVENGDIVIEEKISSSLSSIEIEDIGSYESDARFDDDGNLIG